MTWAQSFDIERMAKQIEELVEKISKLEEQQAAHEAACLTHQFEMSLPPGAFAPRNHRKFPG